MADYKWKPIEDLPADWTKLASSELAGLASVWREHYERVKDTKALKQFNERLRREWAIETGIIENLYYIDRGVTLTLIEKGIQASLIPHGTTDKPAELIVPILKDQEEVVTGLFDFVGQQRQLSTSYIKQLHQALTQHQRTTAAKDSFGQMIEVELLRGDWKRMPNNPTKSDGSIHEYCPPEQVASEMDQLIAWHQEHLEKGVPPEVEAAWLHHRFTQIHPFQDGNGRMARTLASLIFLRARLFPLVIHRDERDEYIDALEMADQKNLRPLVQLFSRLQKRAINQVVSLSETILSEEQPIEAIISSAIDQLRKDKNRYFRAVDLDEKLLLVAEEKFRVLLQTLQDRLQEVDKSHTVSLTRGNNDMFPNLEAYEVAVRNQAQELGYEAVFDHKSKWLFLSISTNFITDIFLSFYDIGQDYLGLYAISAFSQWRTWFDNHPTEPLQLLSKETFQFTDFEDQANVLERFNMWLDEVILNGLSYWRKHL